MSLKTLLKIVNQGHKLTPMIAQYFEIKKQYPDIFLMYRMGDFYEVFFEDAIEVAQLLNITQTYRGKIGDTRIPMAGIPHHAASTYIDKLTTQGYKVAICEQIEDPKTSKGIVKRAVTQISSPGIPYDIDKTDPIFGQFIAAFYFDKKLFYGVVIDFTTGHFEGFKVKTVEEFLSRINILSPREVITYMGQWENFPNINEYFEREEILKTHLSMEYFDLKITDIYTEKLIPSFKHDTILKCAKNILSPIGALAYYITSTQYIESLHHIKPFKLAAEKGKLKISKSTLKGLEIIPKNKFQYKNSLLGFMDKTITSMGTRKLYQIFLNPISSLKEIIERQKLIKSFINNFTLLEQSRNDLKNIRDLDRILAKVSTGKITASNIISLSSTISIYYNDIETKFENIINDFHQTLTKSEWKKLLQLSKEIIKTLNNDPSSSLEKGNLIKEGYNQKRDRLSKFKENAYKELATMEESYRQKTGISNLKIKFNNIQGHFIEISKSHLKKVPNHFQRKQTLTNSERFLTNELIEFEKEIITAKERLSALEREIFQKLINQISNLSTLIMKLSSIISHFDVFQSFAWIAIQEEFICPTLNKNKKIINIKEAFHPLIKEKLKDRFVGHNIYLDDKKYFGLITGPNMAGKTTVMREVAIIQFLAQIGSFVPASNCEVGLRDYLFSRLGASDDILKGQSTFMVEMTETAEIIRHATKNSLIILDEVGRGTSTHDGLSIAWALVEHFIKKTGALTLFATHYHELIEVVEDIPQAKNFTVEITNKKGKVNFLYNLIERGASQSFGIYVAKLAGIPKNVLDRSNNILENLENQKNKQNNKPTDIKQPDIQLSFLDEIEDEVIPEYLLDLENQLQCIDIKNTTPLNALHMLNKLKKDLPILNN